MPRPAPLITFVCAGDEAVVVPIEQLVNAFRLYEATVCVNMRGSICNQVKRTERIIIYFS